MKIELVPINSIKPDPENVRLHGQESIDAITTSLRAYKQMKPLVVRQGVVIAGNGTLEAAIALGWKQIAIVRADHLSADQATAYAIADNKTADLSTFDYERLSAQLRDLGGRGVDLTTTAFRTHEIEPLLQADWTPPEPAEMPEDEEDAGCRSVKFSESDWQKIEPRLPREGKTDADRIVLAILGTSTPKAKLLQVRRRL
jgi:ParB family chromosome partitioning protein